MRLDGVKKERKEIDYFLATPGFVCEVSGLNSSLSSLVLAYTLSSPTNLPLSDQTCTTVMFIHVLTLTLTTTVSPSWDVMILAV